MSNYKYIEEFTCEKTGDRMIVVKDVNGNKLTLEYMDYIHNYYSQAEYDAYMYQLETS